MTVLDTLRSQAGADSSAPKVAAAGQGAARTGSPLDDLMGKFDMDAGTYAAAGSGSGAGSQVVDIAKKYLGTPYKWGGASPLGFDCSGFVQYVYKQATGVDLPRLSYQQATYGARIPVSQAKPGDLIAWDNSTRNNGADHIGIYAGNGMVLNAPKPGGVVELEPIWGSPWAVSMGVG